MPGSAVYMRPVAGTKGDSVALIEPVGGLSLAPKLAARSLGDFGVKIRLGGRIEEVTGPSPGGGVYSEAVPMVGDGATEF